MRQKIVGIKSYKSYDFMHSLPMQPLISHQTSYRTNVQLQMSNFLQQSQRVQKKSNKKQKVLSLCKTCLFIHLRSVTTSPQNQSSMNLHWTCHGQKELRIPNKFQLLYYFVFPLYKLVWTLCIMHRCVISRKRKKREKKRPKKKMRTRKKKRMIRKGLKGKEKKTTDQVKWPLGGSFIPSMKSQFHPMVSIGSLNLSRARSISWVITVTDTQLGNNCHRHTDWQTQPPPSTKHTTRNE